VNGARQLALLAIVAVAAAGCAPSPAPVSGPPVTIPALPAVNMGTTGTVPVSTATLIMDEARGWAFRVRSVSCLATGSSFSVHGELITNRHVASGSASLQLSTWSGDDFDSAVAGESRGPDLAQLSASDAPSGTTTASLAAADPSPGTAVWVAGYPEGNELTVTPGQVIDYVSGATLGVDGQVKEATNAIEPGNSGSAVVNSAGLVVGVAFATRVSNNDALVIPVSELSSFVTSPNLQDVESCAA